MNRSLPLLIVDILLAIFLHPLAFLLICIELLNRNDMSLLKKFVWGGICLIWGVGPILYVFFEHSRILPIGENFQD